jgi:hypothetical protein
MDKRAVFAGAVDLVLCAAAWATTHSVLVPEHMGFPIDLAFVSAAWGIRHWWRK